jgi:putative phosphoserine phosphatase / 1-acylglycerol-3-phosphate O-acyltransferase
MTAAVLSDVEGTLVDASLPRLSIAVGRELGLIGNRRYAELAVLGLLAKWASGDLKRRLQVIAVLRSVVGQTEAQVGQIADAMLPRVTQRIKNPILDRLRDHQAQGLSLVLISGAMHPLVTRLAAQLGGRGEGTKMLLRNGTFTSQVDGAVCQGEGKAERARKLIAELKLDPAQSYAYGDTASDLPFLRLFGHPHAVDPDPVLAAEAQRQGWPIVRTS